MTVLLLLAALVVVGFALILFRDLFTVVRLNDPKGRMWLTLAACLPYCIAQLATCTFSVVLGPVQP